MRSMKRREWKSIAVILIVCLLVTAQLLQGFAEQIGWGSCQAMDETAAGATAYLPELELTAVLTVVDQSIYYDHSDAQYREIVHLSLQER